MCVHLYVSKRFERSYRAQMFIEFTSSSSEMSSLSSSWPDFFFLCFFFFSFSFFLGGSSSCRYRENGTCHAAPHNVRPSATPPPDTHIHRHTHTPDTSATPPPDTHIHRHTHTHSRHLRRHVAHFTSGRSRRSKQHVYTVDSKMMHTPRPRHRRRRLRLTETDTHRETEIQMQI